MPKRVKYKYEDYHKEIDGIIFKKCAYHEIYFNEEIWLPCTDEYFYKNKSSKLDGLYPECKKCSSKKALKWENDNRERKRENCRNGSYTPGVRKYHKMNSQRQRDSGYMKEWEKNNKDKLQSYRIKRKLHKTHEITSQEWESCKNYFNYKCAYCGLTLEEHKQIFHQDLHKEHVDGDGANDLSNCISACKTCNSSKNTADIKDWYNCNNPIFNQERLNKVYAWINEDYKKYKNA